MLSYEKRIATRRIDDSSFFDHRGDVRGSRAAWGANLNESAAADPSRNEPRPHSSLRLRWPQGTLRELHGSHEARRFRVHRARTLLARDSAQAPRLASQRSATRSQ